MKWRCFWEIFYINFWNSQSKYLRRMHAVYYLRDF